MGLLLYGCVLMMEYNISCKHGFISVRSCTRDDLPSHIPQHQVDTGCSGEDQLGLTISTSTEIDNIL